MKESSVAESGQSAVDVTFTKDGAKVWQELTEEAVGTGDSARLLVKVGDKLQSVVRVMDAMKGDQAQIVPGTDGSAQDVVDLIQGN
ncbi:SecDF P1 head subdomain-containing protein [Cryobacterium arcticum]|uniref:SecDF P1 head subdomain-containing protein n=1 Tax=Cryobacterium arcticum TaxID=670052 RepID=UPI0011B6BE50|nr:hypothetical protein [Cryobacterium arcticum]